MPIFGTKKQMKREILALTQEMASLRFDIVLASTGGDRENVTKGPNKYDNKTKLVQELIRKYKGFAPWGNQIVQRVIDTRAAFIMAHGVGAKMIEEDAEAELEFIEDFISFNELDGQFAIQLATEQELEGQILLELEKHIKEDEKNIQINFISWNDTKYQVIYADKKFSEVERIFYEEAGTGKEIAVDVDESIFLRFNARANSSEGIPSFSGILRETEDIDEALRDWRLINRLYASPTPYFQTEDMQSAKEFYDQLKIINWKIGKFLTGSAEFTLVGMGGGGQAEAGINSLQAEIETKLKLISGSMGVPIQFLGFPEFMSNRATAENMMEPIVAIAQADQLVWKSGYFDLFNKAIVMQNSLRSANDSPLRENLIEPVIRVVTASQVKRLIELYMPLFMSGKIDFKTFLSMLPDIDDPVAVMDAVNKEGAERATAAAATEVEETSDQVAANAAASRQAAISDEEQLSEPTSE